MPSGRLPVTFYRSTAQLPPFDDYRMTDRTYRYFKGDPLFAFGHGLSYTTFAYSNLTADHKEAVAADVIRVSVDVRNSGKRDGHEVVQLYVRPLNGPADRPVKDLRGFQRIFLKAGETRRITFDLRADRDMLRYSDEKKGLAPALGTYEIQVGASSKDIRAVRSVRILPEAARVVETAR